MHGSFSIAARLPDDSLLAQQHMNNFNAMGHNSHSKEVNCSVDQSVLKLKKRYAAKCNKADASKNLQELLGFLRVQQGNPQQIQALACFNKYH